MSIDERALAADISISQAAEDPLEQLVRENAQFVYQIAYSVLRNPADAEDAAQETFIRVLRHRREIPELIDRRAWLARMTWRIALNKRRKRAVAELARFPARLLGSGSKQPNPEELASNGELVVLLDRLIVSLPEELRNILLLSTVQNISSSEIAHILDIPESSVRTRLFRARKLLREKLANSVRGRNA